ncbi:hypothetical protein SAMN05216207_1001398 [Pseudonocardia ammonioxydans]|uniref:Uncharacterized protein n=1 Tax=Pseudonocardia ammonioxydans TaxID=260086 RepID=A0A1I4SF28_PSUAM|nr:hypothetical protein [Pseudonocardia ammonioxydans]SFM62930.1 hypothetical protein SAMN05216207_1001398 [Pseudonocardia ammonioxydans]
MTGPQQSRPSPRPRHGRADDDFPDNSYQGGGGYPDLRASRPVERPTPSSGGGYEDLYGGTGPQPVIDDAAGYGAGDAGDTPARPAYGEYGDPASRGGTAIDGGPAYPGSATAPSGTGHDSAGQASPAADRRPDHDTADATGPVEYARAAPAPEPARAVEAPRTTGPAGADHTAGGDRTTEPATAEVPAPRGAPESGRRPATVAEAAAARFGAPAPAPAAPGPGEGGGAAGTTGAAAAAGAGAAAATGTTGAAPARGDARHGEAVPTVQPTGGQPTGEQPGGEQPGGEQPGGEQPGGGRQGPGRQQADGRQHEGPQQQGPQQQGRQHGGRQGHTAAPLPTVAKDPTAVTVLRVITYVLVSLSCLVFLAGVVYGVVAWFELREALSTSPLFGGPSLFGG